MSHTPFLDVARERVDSLEVRKKMATAYHMEALRKQRLIDRMNAAQAGMLQASPEHHHHHHHCKHHHRSSSKISRSTTSAQSQASEKSKVISQPNSAASGSRQSSTKQTSPTAEEVRKSQTASSQASLSKRSLGSAQSSHSVGTLKPSTSSSVGSVKIITAPSGPASARSSKVTTPVLAGGEAALSAAKTPGSSGQKRSAAGTPSVQGTPNKTSLCSCSCSQDTCSKCVSDGLCSRCAAESGATSRMSGSRNSTYTPLESPTALEKEEAIRRDLQKQEYVLRDSNLVMGNIGVDEEMQLREQE